MSKATRAGVAAVAVGLLLTASLAHAKVFAERYEGGIARVKPDMYEPTVRQQRGKPSRVRHGQPNCPQLPTDYFYDAGSLRLDVHFRLPPSCPPQVTSAYTKHLQVQWVETTSAQQKTEKGLAVGSLKHDLVAAYSKEEFTCTKSRCELLADDPECDSTNDSSTLFYLHTAAGKTRVGRIRQAAGGYCDDP